MKKICPQCKQEFYTNNKQKIYCSSKCQLEHNQYIKKSYLHIVKCAYCGKEFKTTVMNKICCSRLCINKYWNKKKKFNTYTCEICGKEFKSKQKDIHYCSKQCASTAVNREKEIEYFNSNKWREITNRKLPSLKKKKIWLIKDGIFYHTKKDLKCSVQICKVCGRKFKSISSNVYCSSECELKDRITYIKKICIQCGKEYNCENEEKSYNEFCSEKCMNEYNGNIHTCINCGKTFKCSNFHSFLYCSFKCRKQFIRKRKIHKEVCQQCRKEFFTINGKFCSYACSAVFTNNSETNCFHGYFSVFNHYIRSGWEFNFTLILRYCNRKYIYEYKTFSFLDGTSYTPDFYDIRRNVYYEIKGRYFDIIKKLEKMDNEYPSIKIKLIDKIKFVRIYKFFNKKIKLMDNKFFRKGNFLTQDEIDKYR